MTVVYTVRNEEYDNKCGTYIDKVCQEKNIMLSELFQYIEGVSNQLNMKQQIPSQMGGGELSHLEALIVAWSPNILDRIKFRYEQGER